MTSRRENGRIHCLAPGCGRSWADDGSCSEVLCGRHFRMAPASLRQEYKLAKRALGGQLRRKPQNRDSAETQRLYRRLDDLWLAIRDAAIGGVDRPSGLDGFLEEMGFK